MEEFLEQHRMTPDVVGLCQGYCLLPYVMKNLPRPCVSQQSLLPDSSEYLDTHINSANFTFPSLKGG